MARFDAAEFVAQPQPVIAAWEGGAPRGRPLLTQVTQA
jgi:hypothetical protein